MKIAYVTSPDAKNIKSWSGTPYYMSRSLENLFGELEYIGPLNIKISSRIRFKFKQIPYKYLLGKEYAWDSETSRMKDFTRQITRKLAAFNSDIIFGPLTYPLSYLECKQPVVFWTDSTFAGLIDYYPFHTNLCKESIVNGIALDKNALEKCKLAIFSSEWAAKTAIDNYQIDKDKVKVVPYGANIDSSRSFDDIKNIVDSRPSNKCNLLFLGVQWFRKGGDIAFQVADKLNQAGLMTQLTIIGCQPVTNRPLPNFVKSLGYISKSTEEGRKQIDKALAEAHFLILPVRAECYGIIFCEANSFGTPCLSVSTGGIPTIIQNDLNGKLFSKNSIATEYCAYILNLFSNYSRYKELALSSFQEYQSRLNWSVATQTVKKLLLEVTS